MQLKKFGIEDKPVFDSAFSSIEFPLQELNFNWILLNSVMYSDIEWARINGNICLFLTFEGSRYIYPVLPGNRLQETMEECFRIAEEYNKEHGIKPSPSVAYIPEEFVSQYSSLAGFSLKPQGQDYVCGANELVSLEGPKYKDKRNQRNNLLKYNKVSAEAYSEKHEAACLELLHRWITQKERDVPDASENKFRAEADFAEYALKMAPELGLKGLVVFVNGSLEGFTFGDRANEQMCSIFVEKTNLFVKGLAPFIFAEFVKQCWDGCALVNAGEDWGVEYLKVAKLSYHPEIIHKFYSLVRRG
ncbi:MAG: phosphatidylglycerol lysyltransferase domain-containing protein [Candidatus Woesearchaeota archaeon]